MGLLHWPLILEGMCPVVTLGSALGVKPSSVRDVGKRFDASFMSVASLVPGTLSLEESSPANLGQITVSLPYIPIARYTSVTVTTCLVLES